mgnify:CR=1 FL=1
MEEIYLPDKDKKVLGELARKLEEMANRPQETEKVKLWTEHNDLGQTRPVIFCDPENGWNEIITEDMYRCESELGQTWESYLRKEIVWAENMKDDKVIEASFDVPHVAVESDWGMKERKIGGEHGGAYRWEAPLKDYADLGKLRAPVIKVDYEATERIRQLAEEVFGQFLKVRVRSTKWWWTLGMTWTLVNLRGLEQVMYDFYDYPDELHKVMGILRDGHLAKLDFLERNELLPLNTGNTYVGSGGFGFTKQLPAEGYDPSRVRLKDMWGFAESQETSSVSAEMFAELIMPYQIPVLAKFGLNCYGCCEPLNARWKYIKDIPNLRRVSVSPWADPMDMAEKLGNNYIFSYKPNPAYLAVPNIDEELIRKSIRDIIRTAKGCVLEIIMKDNNTLGGNPNNAFDWVRIAREEAESASL